MFTTSAVIGTLTYPQSPNYIPWSPTVPDPGLAMQLFEVIRRLDEIDKKLGLFDCAVERKQKEKFMRKLKRRAAKK